ncbi:Hypothetical predicted protein [Cloeon dipterum]|uniref:Caspase family p20 domain-containing protein n=1 Tax=Cloeon dipterum TaxID=197152 RepID=A0A8S1CMF1_9INSE|nr:Hypothetical predicted protein [Cloeon dipterum]
MAGKPKLVFVQACKGQKIDKGSKIQVDGLGQLRNEEQKTFNKQSFTIPNNADFFVAFSTCEGYASLRDTNDGSWFVQCLCKQLEKEETHSMSIFQWMTKVNRMVAMEQADNVPLMLEAGQVILERVKQCSAFTSRLTKDLILAPKVTRRN